MKFSPMPISTTRHYPLLYSSEELAQNGLASANGISEFLQHLGPRRSGLCASEELAQNGLASANGISEFLQHLGPRRSGLCAF